MALIEDPDLRLDLILTLVVLVAAIAVFVIGSRIAERPADPTRPRLLPWRPVILTAGVLGLLAVVHVFSLIAVANGARP